MFFSKLTKENIAFVEKRLLEQAQKLREKKNDKQDINIIDPINIILI